MKNKFQVSDQGWGRGIVEQLRLEKNALFHESR
jgi:hypothetical protein